MANEPKLEKCASWLGIPLAPEKETLSPKNIRMVQRILTHTLHDCCPIESMTPHIPARLVYVGNHIDSVPHLVLRGTLRKRGTTRGIKYAALSYCWGPETEIQVNAKTTISSVADRIRAIDLKNLPQFLQDAIRICQVLSIRYIWIDMLCILQGDPVDFENESQDMARIYESAYITIAALASDSCTQGFLSRPFQAINIPFQSRINPRIRGTYTMTYRPRIRGKWPLGGKYTPFRLDLESSQWHKRGWIVQEENMSSRLLYFGESRIHFRCRHRQFRRMLIMT